MGAAQVPQGRVRTKMSRVEEKSWRCVNPLLFGGNPPSLYGIRSNMCSMPCLRQGGFGTSDFILF